MYRTLRGSEGENSVLVRQPVKACVDRESRQRLAALAKEPAEMLHACG